MASILLIDDDQFMRGAVSAALKSQDHEVSVAQDGLQGLHALQQNQFDLIITDIVMPRTEGLEFIQTVRQIDPKTPIIAISGEGLAGGKTYIEHALMFGAQAGLQKPLNFPRLLQTVQDLVPSSAN